ncbi:MAG: tetratricopeptide repeat protein [Acidimicrobiales bacterium]
MPGIKDAERALALADEAFSRFELDAVVAHLSAAIREFTTAERPCQAAMACVRLGDVMANYLGNLTAARAWFSRATRLVADQPPCLEQGWVAVAAMGCDVDDPAALLAGSELALDRARRFGDLNLETKALADAGLAHVQLGHVVEGMALLDEAMALACGPADDRGTAAKSVCSFFTACYFAVDFERAGSWADLLRQRGLIGLGAPGPVFLSSHCDSVQATLLLELGRWHDAEALLERARADFEATMGTTSWHPDIALADLRTRQGRYAEAEVLLLGKDQSMQALLPAARLHLERGDPDLSIAAARRGLRVMGDDRLRAAELLTVLVEAHLARGDIDAAGAAWDALTERTGDLPIAALQARAAAAGARVLAARGDLDAAIGALETTVDALDATRLPWLHATLLLDLARVRDRAGASAAASRAAVAAAAALALLDVNLRPADVALLERMGEHISPATAGGPAPTASLTRDGTWWVAACGGTSVRLRDTKGMRYLAELVAVPGSERHALDLVDRVEGVGTADEPDRRSLGNAGEVIDTQARTAYRHRIEALRSDIDDALDDGRLDAAEVLHGELDALVAQLAQAFGLGGRSRVASSAAERARLNVTRALRAALAKLADALPGPGAVLDRTVRTGLYCAYEPVDGEVRWIVQS